MSKNLLYSLMGFFAVLSFLKSEPTNTSHTPSTPPPVDKPYYSDDRRREILEEQLKFIQNRFKETPNKNAPIARVGEKKVEEIIDRQQNNPSAKPVSVQAEEVTKFSLKQGELAVNSVIRENRVSDEFLEFTKNVDLDNAVQVLKDIGYMQNKEGQTIRTDQKAAVYLPTESARVAYLAAAFKLKKDAERFENKTDPTEEAKEKAEKSALNLNNSLQPRLGSGYTKGTNNFGPSNIGALAGGYLDIAAKQITNATNTNSRSYGSNDSTLQTPFETNSTELSKKFAAALNTANSLDLLKDNVGAKLKPFKDLINSKDFLEYGKKLLGEENTNALVSAVQAADLLTENSEKLNAEATEYLAGAFNLGTGIAAPPCIGCVETKNSPLVKDAEVFVALGELPDSATQEWIDEARNISDLAGRNKDADLKEVAALLKGRIELEQVLNLLEKYKSQGALQIVSNSHLQSMSNAYKTAAETAAGVLFIVINKRIKTNTSPKTTFKINLIKKSASKLLAELKTAKNPFAMETALRNFFEKSSFEEARGLWRDFELSNYIKLRSLTAQIITARAFSALRSPSFEKITLERAALAHLTNKSLLQLQERKSRELKEQQIRLGILKLPDIKMADEKEAKKNIEKDIPIDRFPSSELQD